MSERKFNTKSGKIKTLIGVTEFDKDTFIGTDKETGCNSMMNKALEIVDKTKLIVVNEHTLGYIMPGRGLHYGVLHSSILKGAPFELNPSSKMILPLDRVRLASEKDFEEFRCSFEGYAADGQHIYQTEE